MWGSISAPVITWNFLVVILTFLLYPLYKYNDPCRVQCWPNTGTQSFYGKSCTMHDFDWLLLKKNVSKKKSSGKTLTPRVCGDHKHSSTRSQNSNPQTPRKSTHYPPPWPSCIKECVSNFFPPHTPLHQLEKPSSPEEPRKTPTTPHRDQDG
jgi:hypothetical protein